MIDLRPRQLEAFLAVAAELHFSRAAQRLGIAQSAVSQQVRRLEQALGVELLTRTSRRVQLTPAGEALRRQAPGLLGRIDGLAHTVQALAAGEAGTVVLGAQGAALIGIVPQALQRLGAELPQLQVVVRQLTSREQVEGLRLGTLDLALVRDLAPQDDLVITQLHREPVLAVLPENHPLARQPTVDVADLADDPLVLWDRAGAPHFYDALMATCHQAGFQPRIEHRVRGIDARLSYIAAGLGVGLEAATYAAVRRDGVTFKPLTGNPIHATVQLARSERLPSPAAARTAAALTAVPAAARSH